MARTRVFKYGSSQAVRIPREFEFRAKEVEILRRGDEIILRECPRDLSEAFEILAGLYDDFFADGRQQPETGKRESL